MCWPPASGQRQQSGHCLCWAGESGPPPPLHLHPHSRVSPLAHQGPPTPPPLWDPPPPSSKLSAPPSPLPPLQSHPIPDARVPNRRGKAGGQDPPPPSRPFSHIPHGVRGQQGARQVVTSVQGDTWRARAAHTQLCPHPLASAMPPPPPPPPHPTASVGPSVPSRAPHPQHGVQVLWGSCTPGPLRGIAPPLCPPCTPASLRLSCTGGDGGGGGSTAVSAHTALVQRPPTPRSCESTCTPRTTFTSPSPGLL